MNELGLLPTMELLRATGASRDVVDALRERGLLHPVRIGFYLFYEKSSVEIVRRHRSGGTPAFIKSVGNVPEDNR